MRNDFIQREYVDDDTGEVKKQKGHKNFYKFFKYGLELLDEIGGSAKYISVLCYIIDNMNWDNYLSRSQSQIAEDNDISRSYASKILNRLEEVNILISGKGNYMVNPSFIFYGEEHRWVKAYNVYNKRRMNKHYE